MFNIVVDLSYFVPFYDSMDQTQEMLTMLSKVKPTPVISPLEAMGKFDPDKGVMTLDAYLDSLPNDMRTDNYDRHNWIDAISEKIFWVNPFLDNSMSRSYGVYVSPENSLPTERNIKIDSNTFPSMSVLERSKVFIEMNMFYLNNCPQYVRAMLQRFNLINPIWFKRHNEPVDYSASFEGLREARGGNYGINYREVFLP